MYSYGPPHMAEQKQDNQLKHTFSSYVRIRDVALKTYHRWWTIGRSGERGSGISVLTARHDDDDYAVNAVSGCYNKYFFALFHVIFGSLYWVDAIFTAGESSSSFSSWQSQSSLGCKASCIVISFLLLLSIRRNSSLVLFKNGPEYLTSGSAQVFIPLMRFMLQSLLSNSFLVWLRYLIIFSFISNCFMLSASNIPKCL